MLNVRLEQLAILFSWQILFFNFWFQSRIDFFLFCRKILQQGEDLHHLADLMFGLVLALDDVGELLYERSWLLEGSSAWREWLRWLVLLAWWLVEVLLLVHVLLVAVLCRQWDSRRRLGHIKSLLVLVLVVHVVVLVRQHRVTLIWDVIQILWHVVCILVVFVLLSEINLLVLQLLLKRIYVWHYLLDLRLISLFSSVCRLGMVKRQLLISIEEASFLLGILVGLEREVLGSSVALERGVARWVRNMG